MKKNVALYGVLVALALILSFVESLLPVFFPVPGMKLGLANIAILFALYTLGIRASITINFIRIFLAALLFAGPVSIIYSLAGGALSLLIMILLKRRFSLVVVSIAGGVCHNLGQILVAMLMLNTVSLGYYFIVLWFTGIATGAAVGIIGFFLIFKLPWNKIGISVCQNTYRRNIMDKTNLNEIAKQIRIKIIESTYAAKSGHPGGSLSATEIFTYLYFKELNVDEKNPAKPDRDRFVLSKGHTAPGLYAALGFRGFFPIEDMYRLRHIGCHLQGHPSMTSTPGIDMSTGSLGQGISAAVGMAISAKISSEDYRVYTLLGDGELEEGQVWEACMLAGNMQLDNLCVIVDFNNLQIDGTLAEVNSPEPMDEKFKAFKFNVITIDGHSFEELEMAFKKARETKGMPTAIIAKTIKGKGVSFMENNGEWHGKATNEEEYHRAMKELGAE